MTRAMPEIEKWLILNHRNRTEKSYETVTNSVKPLSSPVHPHWCLLCVFVFWCILYYFRSTARKKIEYTSIYTKMIDFLFPYKNLSSQCLEPSKTGDSGVCLDPVWFVGAGARNQISLRCHSAVQCLVADQCSCSNSIQTKQTLPMVLNLPTLPTSLCVAHRPTGSFVKSYYV